MTTSTHFSETDFLRPLLLHFEFDLTRKENELHSRFFLYTKKRPSDELLDYISSSTTTFKPERA